MAKTLITVSAKDAEVIREMVADWARRRGSNRPRGPTLPPPEDGAPEVYVALTPADGIPAMTPADTTTGTGTGNEFPVPSSAECEVYRILPQAHIAGHPRPTGAYALRDAGFSRAEVWNVSFDDVPGDTYVVIKRDKFGSWLAEPGSAAISSVWLMVNDIVGPQDTFVDCFTGTGSGVDDECGFVFHHAFLLDFDSVCQRWVPGECVIVVESNGRRLELDRPYLATPVGTSPTMIGGILSDPDRPQCVPTGDTLYAVDRGDGPERVLVGAIIGRLCDSGTGTGTADDGIGGQVVTASTASDNIILYHGTVQRWDADRCAFLPVEGCLVANANGCELPDARRVSAGFDSMITVRRLPALADDFPTGCAPLYLTTERKTPQLVGDVRCVAGVLKVYFISEDDACEETLVEGHDAGCCDCAGDVTTGTGGGGTCWCDGSPTSTTFTASTFTLSNGTCGACAGIFPSPSFPSTITVTRDGTNCTWSSTTVVDPCGGTLGATLTVTAGGAATFVIGGGTHDITAQYSLASGFNCNGSNTFSLDTNGAGCGGWPATITVAP